MPLVRMHIIASSVLDTATRHIAVSIDTPVSGKFAIETPELVVGTAYKYFNQWINIDIPTGSHTVYIGIDAPESLKWIVEWEIPKIITGRQELFIGSWVKQTVTMPEFPASETVTAPYTTAEIEAATAAAEKERLGLVTAAEVAARLEAPVTPIVTPLAPVVTAPVVPSLPWYVAWLQPVLDYLGVLSESVVNWFTPIFKPIQDGVNAIKDFPKNLISGIITSVGAGMDEATAKSIDTAVSTVTEIGKGTPEWSKDLTSGLSPIIDKMTSGYSKALNPKTYEKSPLTGSQAVEALDFMKNELIATAVVNFNIHAAVEAASLGQFEFMSQIEPMIVAKYGLNEVIQKATMLPIEKAIIIPAEQELNSRYQQNIPSSTDLIDMVLKNIISVNDFQATMRKNGFSDNWAHNMYLARFNLPSYMQVLNAYFRGVIKTDELETYRDRLALDSKYKVIWDSLTEVIPDYSELTNELVKEVIDLPTYTKYLQWHGFNAEWSKRIWDAHFYPPSLGDILTAWRRGIIDEAEVDRLMIIVDLDPRFKNVFDTRKYADPSLMITRMMYETGAIGADEVPDLIHRQGYSPEHEKAVSDYVLRFQERLWRRRYLVSLSTAASLGAASADMVRKEVTDAGYSEGVAEWMIKAADMRTKIASYRFEHPKPKLLSIGNLKDAYLLDKMDAGKLRIELLQRGYLLDEVDLLISLMDEDKIVSQEGKRVVALSIPQLLDAYRYKEMTRDSLMIKLQTRGLALDETETLIKTKEKQWGMIGG